MYFIFIDGAVTIVMNNYKTKYFMYKNKNKIIKILKIFKIYIYYDIMK